MIETQDLAADTLAVVLAGGKGTRLGALTKNICKPALPFGAAYRNIDFTLSNCVNSGIRRIGVATQHKPASLLRHIEDVWSTAAAGPSGFIEAWSAQARAPREGYKGTADAVFRNLDLIRGQDPRTVLVLAGDHVYQMDYRPMIEFHRRRRADVTVGCIEIDARDADQFGILSLDRQGRIDRFIEKPKTVDERPPGDTLLASMGIYVFDADFLSRVLHRDAFSTTSRHDFGGDILPSLLRKARVFGYPFLDRAENGSAYWRDVGTPAAYWRAHLELLDASPSLRLDDPGWPLPAGAGRPRMVRYPARTSAGKDFTRSLVAEGCEVSGTVHRSVLFSGARVAQGAIVESSVVLPEAVVGRNCRLSGVIVDGHCRIPDGTVISAASWRDGAEHVEPVVLAAEDFVPERAYSYA
ncbi:MAG TPA: sugar phosphate nucleotidyltransferase [Woeseiaceae bacterium]|nr:sugar phosphate nucleotidyltransferase [Woeseiaceae bacterium]